MFPRRLRCATALIVASYWCVLHVAPAAAAVTAPRLTGATSVACPRDADLIAVKRALEHRLVEQKLRDYGVTAADVEVRLASMSDEELHTLASASRGLPSGGDGVGVLISLLIVVLLIILILKLLNKEIVVR
jgi:anti-sigma factor RsiW